MAHISITDAQAWAETSRLTFDVIDVDLEASISDLVLSQLGSEIDVSSWVDTTSTPSLVKRVIAMLYVSFLIARTYEMTEDGKVDAYSALLEKRAGTIITGILTGAMELLDAPDAQDTTGDPVFYPNDDSSALTEQDGIAMEDTSVGPAKFSMGKVF